MRLEKNNIKISIDELLVITIMSSLFSPCIMKYLSNYYACFLFILFHETAHVLVASLFGKRISEIRLSISGISININKKVEIEMFWIIIFLAGPIANIVLACMFINIPIVFEINIALAIINILPICPLDGYNILKILIKWYVSQEKSEKTINIISNIFLTILTIISLNLVIQYMNFSLIILTIYILIEEKYLSKNV